MTEPLPSFTDLAADLDKQPPHIQARSRMLIELVLMVDLARDKAIPRARLLDWMSAFVKHHTHVANAVELHHLHITMKQAFHDGVAKADGPGFESLYITWHELLLKEMEKSGTVLKNIRDGIMADYTTVIKEKA